MQRLMTNVKKAVIVGALVLSIAAAFTSHQAAEARPLRSDCYYSSSTSCWPCGWLWQDRYKKIKIRFWCTDGTTGYTVINKPCRSC